MEVLTPSNYSCATIYKIKKSEIDKIDFALCKQPTETLEDYYDRQTKKPDLLFNGGFFALSTGATVFTYQDEGKNISYNKDYLEGISVKDNDLIISKYDSSCKDFVTGYPILVKDGNIVDTDTGAEIDYNARRTILGYDDIYVYVIIIESPGYAFSKIRSMLSELKIKNAINLDGGGSTRLLVNGKRVSKVVYSRPVDNVVAIYLKQDIIYRVQTGAFAVYTNAERYRDTIRGLPDELNVGYRNAYIRVTNNLYKVQVGAFRNRNNAERVLEDLKYKGYNAFITTL